LMAKSKTPSLKTLLTQAQTFRTQYGAPLNLRTQIQNAHPSMALAAEFKRASPSKGNILPPEQDNEHAAGTQSVIYADAGACVISILTEGEWFKGSLEDLTLARRQTTEWAAAADDTTGSRTRPAILRKDFITSQYQIAEAAAAGADSLLLIVAVTPAPLLKSLIDFCRDTCDMEPLVEVHAAEELDVALKAGARVIGVNNRNLHTMVVDMGTAERTANMMRDRRLGFEHEGVGGGKEYALCALSGMSTAEDVERYRKAGLGMCLIGESLMRAADTKAAIEGLCLDPAAYSRRQLEDGGDGGTVGAYVGGTKVVKVCGITNPEDATLACTNGANLIGVIFVEKSKRCVTVESGKAIVEAVRAFGERTARLAILTTESRATLPTSPLANLRAKSRRLEETSRQRPLVVGVFQNHPEEFIARMVEECGLDLVQLHGKEGMEAACEGRCGGVPAIRVVDIEMEEDGSNSSGKEGSGGGVVDVILNAITTDPIAILLDTSIRGSKAGGGTGVTFDWSIAEKLQNHGLPVLVAGGLTPINVGDAVKTVRPWGVDVSSGVEASPGRKDKEKVGAFLRGARDAAVEASKGF